ncbi:hypothetical protein CDAR_513231 [Caerostris darwini]|uniref:Uncharacterized protein n=1 Tax=Caerostris darwini TaxID=1538125 RepID=A0AAV4W2I7_9ARAC|nr:hypothetical protein CDAR_513231 [Caerostris darwini]
MSKIDSYRKGIAIGDVERNFVALGTPKTTFALYLFLSTVFPGNYGIAPSHTVLECFVSPEFSRHENCLAPEVSLGNHSTF